METKVSTVLLLEANLEDMALGVLAYVACKYLTPKLGRHAHPVKGTAELSYVGCLPR